MREFLDVALIGPMRQLYYQLVEFVPRFLGMIVLIFIGLLLGWIAFRLIRKSLMAMNFDLFCHRTGFTSVLVRANVHKPPAELLASSIYWLILLSFFVVGLRTLDESIMSGVFSRFFGYLPNLLIAILIFIVGFMVSKFISRSVLIAAVNAQIRSARILSVGVDLLILTLTLSLALEQLGIGQNTIVAAFSILFGGVVLALAIAFGLGGRHLAREFLERRFSREPETEEEEQNQLSHL